jgi:hypothetical protein
MANKKEVRVPKKTGLRKYDASQPTQLVSMANTLKGHIVKHGLYTEIHGKNYAHVEGWQFAGALLGIIPVIESIEDLSKASEIKWRATVQLVNIKTDKVWGRGFAICSNKESKKKSFDEYAILSMAQTRAIGKAYRNTIGWVLKLAGYEGTPSEEMLKMGEKVPEARSQATIATAAKTVVLKEGQKIGPDGMPTYLCANCDVPITDQVADYSMKVHKERLCRDCQPKSKKK